MKKTLLALSLAAVSLSAVADPKIDSSEWPVNPADFGMTAEQYIQTESYAFMGNFAKRAGVNNFFHFPNISTMDDTWVVSPNQDSLYSIATVDASNGFKLEMPETGDRFVSIHVINPDHYAPYYVYGGGTHHFEREQLGSDVVVIGIRTSTDATAEDIAFVAEELQKNYKIIADSNEVDIPELDLATMAKIRAELLTHYTELENIFGVVDYSYKADQNNWNRALAAAGAWGLSPDDTAMYINAGPVNPKANDCYVAHFSEVPAKEFFSLTAYNSDKFLMSNENNIISSNRGVELNEDGGFTAYFGGEQCKNADKNNFIVTPADGWDVMLRAYVPDVEAFYAYEMPEFVKIK